MIDIMIEVMLPEEGVEDALIDADDVEHMWYKSRQLMCLTNWAAAWKTSWKHFRNKNRQKKHL